MVLFPQPNVYFFANSYIKGKMYDNLFSQWFKNTHKTMFASKIIIHNNVLYNNIK